MGSIEGDQLLIVNFPLVCFHFNETWQLAFADFTLKLGEVVMLSASDYFLFDFDSDPFCETGVVDCSARAVAFAGVEKEVIIDFCFIKAYFAWVFGLSG